MLKWLLTTIHCAGGYTHFGVDNPHPNKTYESHSAKTSSVRSVREFPDIAHERRLPDSSQQYNNIHTLSVLLLAMKPKNEKMAVSASASLL